ncbi:MAG: M23 family metallopeptidase [Candidatus Cryptobacteroides sp.]
MAKRKGYVFDRDSLSLRKAGLTFGAVLKFIAIFATTAVTFTVIVYLLFSLLFNTKEEAALIEQNRAYEQQIPRLQKKADMLADELAYLSGCDSIIYRSIFRSDAPKLDIMRSFSFLGGIGSVPDTKVVEYSTEKLQSLESKASAVEDNLRAVLMMLSRKSELPPMASPVAGLSPSQVGASVGDRINPYYKVPVFHGGMDIISEADVPVLATGNGVVTSVKRSMKGQGNVVTVSHPGGYHTRYAHLSSISVRKGAAVRTGMKIGGVGVSGNAYAPHLHYEVIRDTVVVNPVNYMFASFGVSDYVDMLVISSVTKQSMD